MATTTTVRLEGFQELDDVLGQLERRTTQKAVLRRALKTAAEPIARRARSLAPVFEENLVESIDVSTRLTRRQSRIHRKMFRDERAAVEMFVGPNDASGVQQEFGNERHSPQPFMRPAWDAEKLKTLERLKVEIADELTKALARAGKLAPAGRI